MIGKLHWSPRSPFVRKIMIALHEAGLLNEVELVRNVVATALPCNPAVMADNPLNKIPTLVPTGQAPVFDSRVILEYLECHAGIGLTPSEPEARLRHLRWQALADGMTDVLLVWRVELNRPGGPWSALTDGYETKVRATLKQLDQEADALMAEPFGIGHIAVICAIGQLDFRWSGSGWRARFPRLDALVSEMAKRPSVQATEPEDDDPAASAAHPLNFSKD